MHGRELAALRVGAATTGLTAEQLHDASAVLLAVRSALAVVSTDTSRL
jgi:hypothetical protein